MIEIPSKKDRSVNVYSQSFVQKGRSCTLIVWLLMIAFGFLKLNDWYGIKGWFV